MVPPVCLRNGRPTCNNGSDLLPGRPPWDRNYRLTWVGAWNMGVSRFCLRFCRSNKVHSPCSRHPCPSCNTHAPARTQPKYAEKRERTPNHFMTAREYECVLIARGKLKFSLPQRTSALRANWTSLLLPSLISFLCRRPTPLRLR